MNILASCRRCTRADCLSSIELTYSFLMGKTAIKSGPIGSDKRLLRVRLKLAKSNCLLALPDIPRADRLRRKPSQTKWVSNSRGAKTKQVVRLIKSAEARFTKCEDALISVYAESYRMNLEHEAELHDIIQSRFGGKKWRRQTKDGHHATFSTLNRHNKRRQVPAIDKLKIELGSGLVWPQDTALKNKPFDLSFEN